MRTGYPFPAALGFLDDAQNVLHGLVSHATTDSCMPEERPVIEGAGQHVEDQLYIEVSAYLAPSDGPGESLTH